MHTHACAHAHTHLELAQEAGRAAVQGAAEMGEEPGPGLVPAGMGEDGMVAVLGEDGMVAVLGLG